MTVRSLVAFATFILLSACGPAQQTDNSSEDTCAPVDLIAQAMEIAQNSIVIDTHSDVPYRIDDA